MRTVIRLKKKNRKVLVFKKWKKKNRTIFKHGADYFSSFTKRLCIQCRLPFSWKSFGKYFNISATIFSCRYLAAWLYSVE